MAATKPTPAFLAATQVWPGAMHDRDRSADFSSEARLAEPCSASKSKITKMIPILRLPLGVPRRSMIFVAKKIKPHEDGKNTQPPSPTTSVESSTYHTHPSLAPKSGGLAEEIGEESSLQAKVQPVCNDIEVKRRGHSRIGKMVGAFRRMFSRAS